MFFLIELKFFLIENVFFDWTDFYFDWIIKTQMYLHSPSQVFRFSFNARSHKKGRNPTSFTLTQWIWRSEHGSMSLRRSK